MPLTDERVLNGAVEVPPPLAALLPLTYQTRFWTGIETVAVDVPHESVTVYWKVSVPVNPAGEAVLGLTCFKSLKHYGRTIDLAVISVPALKVREAIEGAGYEFAG